MASRLLAPLPRPGIAAFFAPASFTLPIAITVPPLLADLWESVLRAVPKKKTSHMKKRHRQMAGKALKDVESLNKCPGCGQVKRAHLLCPHCVKDIKQSWKSAQTA
ncbi:54S ribosomal protein L32 [Penicillium capsulatum]|uniref:Large ribosomal subunit protein bL32m n=1 Tax=Penicillium capsulatum TaxID=69766 RepID=A0A9W9LEU2_9EURO|nr:54S ribosomal protein L32 [Penicillium capsulatum]KAJ6112612.1 54S ribosomal protein L32 [Penicillium capsulatum]